MKILCAKSGIEFRCDHFPAYLTAGESHHPIFDMPLKRLWKYFPKWQSGELTKTDSFLLFLAYLNATEMVEWRCHVYQRPDTDKIISSNMESLYYIIGKITAIHNPAFSIPRFVISPETRDLGNVRYWIQTWEQCYADFCNGLKDVDARARLLRKEAGLERLIKNANLHPSRYARHLASWAAEAADFPNYEIYDPEGNETSVSEYWQDIIVKCHTDTSIISIPEKDILKLLEHCELNLELGSIQSHHLFTTLRLGLDTLQGFFSIGSTQFQILGENDSVGESNLQLLISTAPLEPPKRTQYASEFQFLKAKMKYALAVSAGVGVGAANNGANHESI